MSERQIYALNLAVLFFIGSLAGTAFACSSNAAPGEEEAPVDQEQPSSPAPTAEEEKTVDPETFPEVVARVGVQTITKATLLERAQAIRQRLQIGDSTLGFYLRVLDDVVGTELLRQASSARGYSPSETELDAQVETFRARFPDEAQFTQGLTSQGLTIEKLREMMARDLAVEKLVKTEMVPRVTVSEEKKKAFYAENSEQMTRPEQAKVSHILIKVDAGASTEVRTEAQEKAQDLHRRLEAGEDFAALARENSDDPGSKANGGDLSWVSRGQTVPAFETAAFALKAGEMSDVVETQFGFHIIKLAELRPSEVMPYEEVQDRIGEFLNQQGLQEAIQGEVETLKAKAEVEILI